MLWKGIVIKNYSYFFFAINILTTFWLFKEKDMSPYSNVHLDYVNSKLYVALYETVFSDLV